MRLKSAEIENYRAIDHLRLEFDRSLTVLHAANTLGKTSVLNAIAVGLGVIPLRFGLYGHLGFFQTDARFDAPRVRVRLTTTDGIAWECGMDWGPDSVKPAITVGETDALYAYLDGLQCSGRGSPSDPFPVIASYGADRSVLAGHRVSRGYAKEDPLHPWGKEDFLDKAGALGSRDQEASSRYELTDGPFAANASFPNFFKWFVERENMELREQKRQQDLDYQRRDLLAVRKAITRMLSEISDSRAEVDPPRLSFSMVVENGQASRLEVDQLSDGQRSVLALAADLARRMAQANPHLEDPLAAEAIVLVDEIELHLHPSWQQRVLGDLTRTFPNAQFIVTTHSPQVLTTVKPEQVVTLVREDGCIAARGPGWGTYGSEAGDVLAMVMGVQKRPPNEFSEMLDRYRELVEDDKGETEEALALRGRLDEWNRHDPDLVRADVAIRRRKTLQRMGRAG